MRKQKPSAKQIKVASNVVLNGKSFRESMLAEGYTEHSSNRGPSDYIKTHPSMLAAFTMVAQQADMNAEVVKTTAKYRLFDDVVKGKDSGVTRQVELLGRFKEHDWFVRNTDVQIGVFASLADDSKTAVIIDTLAEDPPKDAS